MTDERTIGQLDPVGTPIPAAVLELEQNSGSFKVTIQQIQDILTGLQSINADTTSAQIIAGTVGRISLVDAGATHTFDIDSAYVGQATITTLGTITTGVWNGTAITYANLSFSADIVNADISLTAAIAITKLANGTADQIIKTNSGGTALEFGLIGDANTATFTTTKISTLSKSLLNSAIIYGDQNNSLGAFYLDIDDIAVPVNPAVGVRRLFVDTATGEISVRTNAGATVSLESAGGAQTPWTSDIDADGFDLNDLSNIEFRTSTGAPAGSVKAIYASATRIFYNVPTGQSHRFTINNATEFDLSNSNANFINADITVGATNKIHLDGSVGGDTHISQTAVDDLLITVGGESGLRLQETGTEVNVVCGATNVLALTATDGFLYISSGAGTPTGTPTAYTGKIAMFYDTTANKIWFYNGAWRGVLVT